MLAALVGLREDKNSFASRDGKVLFVGPVFVFWCLCELYLVFRD